MADDARAQVVFDAELVTSYHLVGYENRGMDDQSFGDLSADAGELGAGHRASALYDVQPAPGIEPGSQIGLAKVLWKTPGIDAPGSAIAPVLAADPETPLPDTLALATAVADLAEVLKGYGGDVEGPTSLAAVRLRALELARRGVPGASDLARLAERLGYLG